MSPSALVDVSVEDGPGLHVLEAELAEEELGEPSVLLRVGRRVPGRDVELAELDVERGPAACARRRRAQVRNGNLREEMR